MKLKRIFVSFLSFILIFQILLPFKGSAYIGGLLEGKSPDGVYSVSNAHYINDNNLSSATFYNNTSSAVSRVRFSFEKEMKINQIYYKGDQGETINFRLTGANGTTLWEKDTTNLDGYLTISTVEHVQGVDIVRTGKTEGETAYINEIDVYGELQDISPPKEITNITKSYTHEEVEFTWTNPTDTDFSKVLIYRDDIKVSETSSTRFTQEISPETAYTYKFKTIDTTGNVSEGITVSFTSDSIPDTTPPNEITEVKESVSHNKVNFTWTNPTDTDFSKVWIYRDGVKVSETTETEFTDEELTPETEYIYTFKTADSTGNFSNGLERTITTLEAPDLTPPNEITELESKPDFVSITLTWTNPTDTDFSKVIIYRGDTKIHETTTSTFTDKILESDTSYTYKITTVDLKGNESEGISKTVKTKLYVPNVKDVKVTADSKSVALNWENPESEDFHHVNIYRKVLNPNAEKVSFFVNKAYAEEVSDSGAYTKIFETNGTYWKDYSIEEKTSYEYNLTTSTIDGDESLGTTVKVLVPMETMFDNVNLSIGAIDLLNSALSLMEILAPIFLLSLVFFKFKSIVDLIKKTIKNIKGGKY